MNQIREAIRSIEVGWKSHNIRLGRDKLSLSEMQLLKRTLIEHESVKSLEICICEVEENDMLEFVRSMNQFKLAGLQLLHLGIGDRIAQALATAIQECTLKKLDLGFNLIGEKGARALAIALRDCGLDSLLLCRNNIQTAGAIAIAEAVGRGGTSLRFLDLSKNSIGDKGAKAFAKALPNSHLDTLLLDGTGITHEGVLALAAALKCSPKMLGISLAGNGLKDKSIIAIAEVVPYTSLEMLCLDGNDITQVGAAALAVAVRQSNCLELLDLKRNRGLNNRAVEPIYQSIKTHRSMKQIILSDCRVTVGKMKAFEERLKGLCSDRAVALTMMCTAKLIPRTATKSKLPMLPMDCIRLVAEMLDHTRVERV